MCLDKHHHIQCYLSEYCNSCLPPDTWAFGWDPLIGLINAAAVIFAALIARWGVKSWRKERVDTRRAELTEEALILMYRAFDVFDHIRSPFSFANEGASRVPQDSNETDNQKRERDSYYVPIERIDNQNEFFLKVVDIRPVFKTIFGESSAEPFDVILNIKHKIMVSASMLSHMRTRDYFRTTEDYEKHLKRVDKNETVVWKDYIKAIDNSKEDPIDSELLAAKEMLLKTVGNFIDERMHRENPQQ